MREVQKKSSFFFSLPSASNFSKGKVTKKMREVQKKSSLFFSLPSASNFSKGKEQALSRTYR
jgi:hypothetical protein